MNQDLERIYHLIRNKNLQQSYIPTILLYENSIHVTTYIGGENLLVIQFYTRPEFFLMTRHKKKMRYEYSPEFKRQFQKTKKEKWEQLLKSKGYNLNALLQQIIFKII